MKRIALLISGALLLTNVVFAGGLLTNSNQSIQYVRMLSRNASTELDAVYFNPAGLSQLKDGFHFGLHNQTILQNRTIHSEFPLLSNPDYKGTVTVPAFPTVFAVYKKDKWAFSAGFGPNAGGGSTKFDKGIPSFEKFISTLPASLSQEGIPTTDYSVNMKFEASSIFFGTQLNATYEISDHVSVFGGVRIVNAINTYNGYIKDIQANPVYPAFGYTGTMTPATDFFANAQSILSNLATSSTSAAGQLNQAISAGTPASTPLSEMPDNVKNGVAQLLGAANINSSGMNIGTAAATLGVVSSVFEGKATVMGQQSAATADKKVDVKQTGLGLTPMIGANFHFDKLNIGLKYEHMTTIILTNSTKSDLTTANGTALFPDKAKSGNDIPAVVSVGAEYEVIDGLKVSGSYTWYIDQWVGWGKNVYGQHRSINKDYVELALGAQYNLTKDFAVSAGYLNSNTGVSEAYQSDFSFSNDSYTVGLGFQWNINKRLALDAGMMLTTYKDFTKSFEESGRFDTANTQLIQKFGAYTETYGKDTFTFGVGVGYKIF